MKHREFLWTSFAFGHLVANVRVRCSDFSKWRVYAVYSNRHPPSLFGEHCEILRWRTLRKTLKRRWGRLEKWRVVTESGGDETGDETGSPGDETGDNTAATAGDERDGGHRWGNVCGRRSIYNRRPSSLFGEHCEILRWQTLRNVEEMVGTTREAADGDRVWRGRDGDETGDETDGPGDETGDKAMAGNERDGSDRWGNVYGRREVRIWWGREGSAWRAAFSCGILMRYLLDALGGLDNLPS